MRRRKTLLFALPLLGALLVGCPQPKVPPGETLPVYRVTGTGTDRAAALAQTLGVDAELEAGGAAYAADAFMALPMRRVEGRSEPDEDGQPTVAEVVDLEALSTWQALDAETALARAREALAKAGLAGDAWGPVVPRMSAESSRLEAVDAEGGSLLSRESLAVDTHVSFDLRLDGVPLVGPGAKVKLVYGGAGEVTYLRYALRELERGSDVAVITAQQAAAECAARFRAGGLEAEVRPELVYYAPPLEIASVQTIAPHYLCGGSARIDGEVVQLRPSLLPAIEDRPRAQLTATAAGSQVSARVSVEGGTPPYSYHWSTSAPAAAGRGGAELSYAASAAGSRDGWEQVGVTVIDANGLISSAGEQLAVGDELEPALTVQGIGFEAGTDWIGTCQGLGGSAGNAGGFVAGFGGHPSWGVGFNWGNQNAWERDFIDPAARADGIDHRYVDDVDFTFYTGHAGGTSFTFCSAQADGSLSYTEDPSWGNLDLEWLTIAACGPLQADAAGLRWWQRWGPAFDGLHLMLAYQNVSNDNTVEGAKLAAKTLAGKTVRQAWVETAIEVQPSSVRFGVMGPISAAGIAHYNDHVWTAGSVGPDVRGAAKRGHWLLSGPC